MAELSPQGQRVCDDVLSLVRERIPEERGRAMSGFIRQYLAGISDEDLAQFRTDEGAAALVASTDWPALHSTGASIAKPSHSWQPRRRWASWAAMSSSARMTMEPSACALIASDTPASSSNSQRANQTTLERP